MELLPIKIQPDNLKDTLVEFHFQSDTPAEVLPGLVYQSLKDSYKVVARESRAWQVAPKNFFQVETHDGMQLTSDFVKIHIRQDSIIFNIANRYPRWAKFSESIFKVLERLFDDGHFKHLTRIGLRYISEYPDMEIFEVMKTKPEVSLPGGVQQNMTFRSEVNYKGCDIVLSIANKIPSRVNSASELTYFSLVDVIASKLFNTKPIVNTTTMKEETNLLHQIQKEFFFGILKEDYIATLQPEYQ